MRETKSLGSKTQAQAPFRPKGTFGLSVATFTDSFLMRIRQRTPPDGRQGDQSASRLSHFRCFTSLAPRICSPPDTGTPNNCRGASSLRAVICRRLLPSTLPLKPSASVVGNRGISTLLFAMPFRSSVSRKLCACRAKQNRRAFPHPLVGILNDSPVV
jgi:hypothetical protein